MLTKPTELHTAHVTSGPKNCPSGGIKGEPQSFSTHSPIFQGHQMPSVGKPNTELAAVDYQWGQVKLKLN